MDRDALRARVATATTVADLRSAILELVDIVATTADVVVATSSANNDLYDKLMSSHKGESRVVRLP